MSESHMTKGERIQRAMRIRALVRRGISMTDAADKHKMSRTHTYRILDELEAWEVTTTFEQQAAVLNRMHPIYHPDKWLLASGKLLHAYTQGEVSASLLGDKGKDGFDIGVEPTDDLLL